MLNSRQTGAAGQQTKVAIVGGGIAGLSVAWYLQQLGVSYALLEEADRWGGKILTERVDGGGDRPFVVEGGPDSFIAQKPWAENLARDIGLGENLLGTNDSQRKVYVLNKGKPTPLPDGVLLIVPTKFMPFVLSPLISPFGKIRMGMDLFIPPRRSQGDETLADFIRRRLGNEALDKIAEPLMSGIYNAEAERQSLLATFPRFRMLESKYGSLTRGMLASRRTRNARNGSTHGTDPGASHNGRPRSTFMSLRGGTGDLVDGLVNRLTGDLRLDTGVRRIERHPEGFALEAGDGSTLLARAVVFATPAYVTAELLGPVTAEAADRLNQIRYVSTGTISLAFDQSEIDPKSGGFGLVVPRSERRPINAVTWSSVKFDHRAPRGAMLLRAFFGGSRSPQSMALTDEELLVTVRQELRELYGITARPLFHRIYRWEQSNPQYDVGHLDRVAAIEASLPAGAYVTGSAYRGVGIPDCVKQAAETVKQVSAWLAQY